MEVVDRIAAVQVDGNGCPADPQTVASVIVETFGFDYPEPNVSKQFNSAEGRCPMMRKRQAVRSIKIGKTITT